VDATFVLLDPAHGAVGLREQMAALVATTCAERVEVIGVGGDILGTGTEPELRSPLADALALAATDGLPVPVEVLVAGAGLDGELAEGTVLSRIEQLGGRRVMRVGPAEAAWAMPLFEWHPSEATALVVAAGRGLRGDVEIRSGGHRVHLTDESATIYALAHADVLSTNTPAQVVISSGTLNQAEAAVRAICGGSEIDYERARADNRRQRDAGHSPIEAALQAVIEYQSAAHNDGIDFVTFRRLAEVAGLDAIQAADLRECLSGACPAQHDPPLWRVSAS
jgi:hypothetical protein